MSEGGALKLKKVLILVEDVESRLLFEDLARGEGLAIVGISNAVEALIRLKSESFDLLLLESRIPEYDVNEFLGQVQSLEGKSHAPKVLMIADYLDFKGSSEGRPHRVDEVLHRPFDRSTLQQKFKLLLRSPQPKVGQLILGDLMVDTRSFDVYVCGARIHLTPNEFKLLEVLLQATGEVLSREELIRRVQGEGVAVIDRAVDTHVFSLRKKLGDFGGKIETVRGSGYRIA
jgi:two-component system phosphate regulon response regulator PhoB